MALLPLLWEQESGRRAGRVRLTWRRYDGEVCPRVEKGADIHYIAGEFTQKVYDRLAAYEDAEEQGRLVMLPCKVGDMVYYRRGRDIIGDTVERIIIDGIDNQVLVGAHKVYMFCDFGRNVFLTCKEAEAALKGGRDDV